MADLGAGKKMASTLQTDLAEQLPEYLLKQRWFGGKARKIASADVVDTLPISAGGGIAYIFVAASITTMARTSSTRFRWFVPKAQEPMG